MEIGAHVINAMLILISLLVTALLVQQVWLAIRLADRNEQWLDAIKAVSEELKAIRSTTRGAEVEGASSGGGASEDGGDDRH